MTEKRFQLFDKGNNDYIIDMEYALGYDDPNVTFLEFVGQALTSTEIVDRLNMQDEIIKYLLCVVRNTCPSDINKSALGSVKYIEERYK